VCGFYLSDFGILNTHDNTSMIVCDLDLVCVPIRETKAYSPLIIDGDRVLTLPVSSQAMQTIARRNP
jgi:hypothetical protein